MLQEIHFFQEQNRNEYAKRTEYVSLVQKISASIEIENHKIDAEMRRSENQHHETEKRNQVYKKGDVPFYEERRRNFVDKILHNAYHKAKPHKNRTDYSRDKPSLFFFVVQGNHLMQKTTLPCLC